MTDIQLHGAGEPADRNRNGLLGRITATFADGSTATIVPRGICPEGRQRYAYSVTQSRVPRTVVAGELRSGVGEPVNLLRALAAWASFAAADAEEYAASMSGDAFGEWAYQHDDELSMLALELEENPLYDNRPGGAR
jgi:hypothetical protein